MDYIHVQTMIGVRDLLLAENDTSDPEYKEILNYVENYIKKHCNHEIIQDLVDIDPDRSKIIFYCKHCETTFHNYYQEKAIIVNIPMAHAETCANAKNEK